MRDPQHHHHQTLAQAEGHDNTVGDQMDRMVGLAMSRSHEISYEMFILCRVTPSRQSIYTPFPHMMPVWLLTASAPLLVQ